jgi:hypothetical protein
MGEEDTRRRARPLAQLLLVLGLVAVGIAPILWYFADPQQVPDAASASRREVPVQFQPDAAPPPSQAAATPAARHTHCDFEPLVPPASPRDGHAHPEHPFPGGPRIKAQVFLRAAESAAARHRPRDAEVAWIAACRQNELASASPNVPLARVLGRLGTHYAAAAGRAADPDLRDRLMERAREVTLRSADAYATALGPNASATRQARARVAELDQPLTVTQELPAPSTARAAPGNADAGTVRDAQLQATEQTPAAVDDSPELQQLAADLARLREQAEAVSADPAGLRARAEAARARKDQCGDAHCLRQWYAQRRKELLAEF